MAKLTLTYKTIEPKVLNIPDAAIPQIIEGFAIIGGYQDNLQKQEEDGSIKIVPNPMTKQQFFLQGIMGQFKEIMLRADAAKVEKDTMDALKDSYVAPAITE